MYSAMDPLRSLKPCSTHSTKEYLQWARDMCSDTRIRNLFSISSDLESDIDEILNIYKRLGYEESVSFVLTFIRGVSIWATKCDSKDFVDKELDVINNFLRMRYRHIECSEWIDTTYKKEKKFVLDLLENITLNNIDHKRIQDFLEHVLILFSLFATADRTYSDCEEREIKLIENMRDCLKKN